MAGTLTLGERRPAPRDQRRLGQKATGRLKRLCPSFAQALSKRFASTAPADHHKPERYAMATIDRRGANVSAADPPISTNPNPDLAIKAPARVATTGSNIPLSGLITLDGVTLAAGDRVLAKDQTDARTNGLYNAQTGPWTRTIDAANNSQWTTGTLVSIAAGAANVGKIYQLGTPNPVILGISGLSFALLAVASSVFIGDSSAGGAPGLVPAPPSGSAAAGQFLSAAGNFAVPASGGCNVAFGIPTASIGPPAVNGSATTAMRSDAAPPLSQAIAPIWTQSHTFSGNPQFNLSQGGGQVALGIASQNVVQLQGQGNSLTTAVHINPGSGALPTGTITDCPIHSTNIQAVGSNYGWWTLSKLGCGQSFESGLFVEFGGTTATTAMGPFILQVGIENPPGTFVVFEGFRFQSAPGTSEVN